MKGCEEPDCKSEATYGFKFATPNYCIKHGKEKGAKPQFQVCVCGASVPRFKKSEDERPKYCSLCKTDEMENVVDRRCQCKKHLPTYGMPTDKRPEYCSECRKDGMVNLKDKNKRCVCKSVIPSFGWPNDKRPTCCKKCMKDGMVNLVSFLCACGKAATFGFKDDKQPSCCGACRKDGMENIRSKRCVCKKALPTYGPPGTKKRTHCQECKPDDYVNVVAKLCKCGSSQPHYGFPTDALPTCCGKCREDGMKNLRGAKCLCKGDAAKQPVYGFPNDKNAICCSTCMKPGMVNIKAQKCQCGKSQPIFNYPSEKKGICCNSCKKDGMKDVVTIKCPTRMCKGPLALQEQGLKCPFEQHGKKKYDYYCTRCFQQNFPKDPRTKYIRSKTREIEVRDYLADNFKEPSFIHNKELWTGQDDCTCRRRIDFRALYGNTLLCVEVDEEQHKYRNKKDEALRYDDLMMLHGGKFIFVRLNPDPYRDAHFKQQNPPMEDRLETLGAELKKQIQRIQKGKNKELVEVVYLYFDAI
jgi:hypothetical protein